MANYRERLTLEYASGQRVIVLQCNKSERKSLVKHHKDDGTSAWMSERTASQHPDGTPKHLHIAISQEGIYEVIGQPVLSGFYCIYKGQNDHLYYSGVTKSEVATLNSQHKAGTTYRQALLSMGKQNIF